MYMDEDDERSAYYNNVQDPSADDSVGLLSVLFPHSKVYFIFSPFGVDLVTDPLSLISPFYLSPVTLALCCLIAS